MFANSFDKLKDEREDEQSNQLWSIDRVGVCVQETLTIRSHADVLNSQDILTQHSNSQASGYQCRVVQRLKGIFRCPCIVSACKRCTHTQSQQKKKKENRSERVEVKKDVQQQR